MNSIRCMAALSLLLNMINAYGMETMSDMEMVSPVSKKRTLDFPESNSSKKIKVDIDALLVDIEEKAKQEIRVQFIFDMNAMNRRLHNATHIHPSLLNAVSDAVYPSTIIDNLIAQFGTQLPGLITLAQMPEFPRCTRMKIMNIVLHSINDSDLDDDTKKQLISKAMTKLDDFAYVNTFASYAAEQFCAQHKSTIMS